MDESAQSTGGGLRALLVVLFGLVVTFGPLFVLPSAEDPGPLAFVVGLIQVIAAAIGIAVSAAGFYAFRTGDYRPAVAASTTVIGLLVVGAIGSYVELTGGRLVPIWVWFVAALAVIFTAFGATLQLVSAPDG